MRYSGSVFYKLGNDPAAVDGNLWGPWDPETDEVVDSAMGQIVMKNGELFTVDKDYAVIGIVVVEAELEVTLCTVQTLYGHFRVGLVETVFLKVLKLFVQHFLRLKTDKSVELAVMAVGSVWRREYSSGSDHC